jgi:hypothetical protein
MKRTKKFASLLLAVVMVFALCSTALADNAELGLDGSTDPNNEPGVAETHNEVLNIKKSMIVTNEAKENASGLQVAYPSIDFSYNVSHTNPSGATISDGNVTVNVREGVENGVKLWNGTSYVTTGGIAPISTGKVILNAFGQEVVQGNLQIRIFPGEFTSPGVYRYVITDVTTADTLTASGVARNSSLDTEFVFDVYIQRQDLTTNTPVYKTDSNGDGTADGETTNPYDEHIMKDGSGNPIPAVDGNTGDDKVVTGEDAKKYPNGLEVGGYVLIQDEPTDPGNAITPTNAGTVKEGGLDDVPVKQVTEPTTKTVPVYVDADGTPATTTTDPDQAKKGENGDPIPATDADGNPIYETVPVLSDPADPNSDPITTTHTVLYPVDNSNKLRALSSEELLKSDVYDTHNAQVKKVVTGSMGDTNHEFPFAINITNRVNNANLDYTVHDTDSSATIPAATNNGNFDGTNVASNNVSINDQEVVTVYGLSPFATINVTETNDTDSEYEVKVAHSTSNTDITENAVAKTSGNETISIADGKDFLSVGKNSTVTAYATAQKVWDGFAVTNDGGFSTTVGTVQNAANITYTNNLNQISPTGIALRYAPYLFMLAAAAMFVVLSRKERDADNA